MATTQQLAARLGLSVVVAIVPVQVNVPGTPLQSLDWVTEHETDNTSAGANALMHRQFVANGGGSGGVSFTYAVDDTQAVQILPEDQTQYAQGTHEGNTTSVSIERCVNVDGNHAKCLDNAAKLTAAIITCHDMEVWQVVQHQHWYGKDCPHVVRATPGGWKSFLTAVQTYTVQLRQSPPDSATPTPQTITPADRPAGPDYPFHSAPTISYALFDSVLAGPPQSPARDERNTVDYYKACLGYGINPAVALAFFFHESSRGTAGIATKTRNWGNVRTAQDPNLSSGTYTDPQYGDFAAYPSWYNGLVDWCKRINGPKYLGGNPAMSLHDAIAKYAPRSDHNDPEQYYQIVTTLVQTWNERSGTFQLPQ